MCSMWKGRLRMKKVELVKKLILSALVILYDVLSLFWCYIITSNFVYNLSLIQKRGTSIGIIGGADVPTLIYKMGNVIVGVFSILFVLLSITTVVLLTVSIIQKQTNRKFKILLCIFLTFTLIIYMLIPAQTYAVTLYALVRKLKYIQFIYIIISLIIIVTNILVAIKRRRKTQ